MKIKLREQATKRIEKGFPLIESLDLVNPKDDSRIGEWHEFVGSKGQFIGYGYLGKQNKGIGWIVSHEKESVIDQAFYECLFKEAKQKRHTFFHDSDTTAFRLFNGEGDGLGGVTIDVYNDFAVFSWYNESISVFKEPIVAAFKKVFSEIKGAYEKNRFETSLPESAHLYGEIAEEPLLVKENGVVYATYLNEGMMTGIFLDQKEVRGQLVKGLAKDKEVLNTFSYTGAFSVAAAIGGAKSTVSVDLAKRSLPKTKEMFEVNKLSLENHKIVVMDIFDYIRYANRKNLSFDMVILDPPGFARNKKRTFSVVKNYGELVSEVTPLIRRKGYLIASTNVANLEFNKFKEMVESGIKAEGRIFKQVTTYRLPKDFVTKTTFKEGNYLKVLVYQLA